MRLPTLFLLPTLTFVASVSCGGATPEPVAPSDTAPGAAPGALAPAPSAWSRTLSKEQQVAYMSKNVVPAMGPVFKGHDAAKYAAFGCKTCHGPDNKDPHDFLPALTVKDGTPTAFADDPAMAKFMAEAVEPKMAAAMGVAPYDMKTKQGFGCGGCHKMETK